MIMPENSGLYTVISDRLYGMIDTAGLTVIPWRYEQVRILRDQYGNATDLIEVWEDGKRGLYDRCGNLIAPPRYTQIRVFHEGFSVMQRKYKFGLLDLEGREVIPPVYNNMHDMQMGMVAAEIAGKWGFLDAEGEERIPFRYEAVDDNGFFQGRVAVRQRGAWTLVDRRGVEEVAIRGKFRGMGVLSDKLITACLMNDAGQPRYGYINANGKEAIPFEFDRTYAFQGGLGVVAKYKVGATRDRKKMLHAVIDRKGRVVYPFSGMSFVDMRRKRDSLAFYGRTSYQNEGKNCKIDRKGKVFDCAEPMYAQLQVRYSRTRCNKGPLFAVSDGEKWGYCDRSGKLVVPMKYAAVGCFDNGLALVSTAKEGGKSHRYLGRRAARAYSLDQTRYGGFQYGEYELCHLFQTNQAILLEWGIY
ncbi:MAG: WG repeat-containing protein [Bacteroidota bacterium]